MTPFKMYSVMEIRPLIGFCIHKKISIVLIYLPPDQVGLELHVASTSCQLATADSALVACATRLPCAHAPLSCQVINSQPLARSQLLANRQHSPIQAQGQCFNWSILLEPSFVNHWHDLIEIAYRTKRIPSKLFFINDIYVR